MPLSFPGSEKSHISRTGRPTCHSWVSGPNRYRRMTSPATFCEPERAGVNSQCRPKRRPGWRDRDCGPRRSREVQRTPPSLPDRRTPSHRWAPPGWMRGRSSRGISGDSRRTASGGGSPSRQARAPVSTATRTSGSANRGGSRLAMRFTAAICRAAEYDLHERPQEASG